MLSRPSTESCEIQTSRCARPDLGLRSSAFCRKGRNFSGWKQIRPGGVVACLHASHPAHARPLLPQSPVCPRPRAGEARAGPGRALRRRRDDRLGGALRPLPLRPARRPDRPLRHGARLVRRERRRARDRRRLLPAARRPAAGAPADRRRAPCRANPSTRPGTSAAPASTARTGGSRWPPGRTSPPTPAATCCRRARCSSPPAAR